MGVNCQVIKKDNKVVKVLSPNGNESLLYKSALEKSALQESALLMWATAYTQDFKVYYGDWQYTPTADQDLDANGEPVYSDVRDFMDSRQGIAPPLEDSDIRSLRELMLANNIRNAQELNEAMMPFMRGGEIAINSRALKQSGLYSADEINRILSNPVAQESLRNLVAKFNSMMLAPVSERNSYLLSNEYEGDIVYESEVYNASGKKEILNPYKIDQDIQDKVGGIKDRQEFDKAFSELPYESVVERYLSDSEYADNMFDVYSSMDRVQVVDVMGNSVTDSAESTLASYSFYNKKAADALKSDISALVSVEEDLWQDRVLITEGLRRVAENGAKMGIDLTALEAMYDERQQSQIEDFLLGLDLFVRSLSPGRALDLGFAADYDSFFGLGNPTTVVTVLNENERDLSIVALQDNHLGLSDVNLYNQYGLNHIRENLYHKVDARPKEELYQTLYEIQEANNKLYGSSMLPIGDTSGMDRNRVISKIKEWINKNTRYNQSEEMAINKAIFGLGLENNQPTTDIGRELSRFIQRQGIGKATPQDALELRQEVLKEKLKDSSLYRNVLSNVVFEREGYTVSLGRVDSVTLRDMELQIPEKIRGLMMKFAMNSDSNIRELFHLNSYPDIYRNIDFYRDLYARHPELAPKMDLDYENLENGRIRSYYAGDLVLVGNQIMEKIAEDGGMSVFEAVANISSAEMDYTGQRANERLSPEAYALRSYSRDMVVEDSFVESNLLEKESKMQDIINKRSC